MYAVQTGVNAIIIYTNNNRNRRIFFLYHKRLKSLNSYTHMNLKINIKTGMHSSRIRTVRCSSRLLGVSACWGVSACQVGADGGLPSV